VLASLRALAPPRSPAALRSAPVRRRWEGVVVGPSRPLQQLEHGLDQPGDPGLEGSADVFLQSLDTTVPIPPVEARIGCQLVEASNHLA